MGLFCRVKEVSIQGITIRGVLFGMTIGSIMVVSLGYGGYSRIKIDAGIVKFQLDQNQKLVGVLANKASKCNSKEDLIP